MKNLSILVTRNTWLVCHLVVSILMLFAVLMSLSSINIYFVAHRQQVFDQGNAKKSPKLYDKLKIIAYDDPKLFILRRTTLPSDDLFTLIKNLEKRNPKAILIDSLYPIILKRRITQLTQATNIFRSISQRAENPVSKRDFRKMA